MDCKPDPSPSLRLSQIQPRRHAEVNTYPRRNKDRHVGKQTTEKEGLSERQRKFMTDSVFGDKDLSPAYHLSFIGWVGVDTELGVCGVKGF